MSSGRMRNQRKVMTFKSSKGHLQRVADSQVKPDWSTGQPPCLTDNPLRNQGFTKDLWSGLINQLLSLNKSGYEIWNPCFWGVYGGGGGRLAIDFGDLVVPKIYIPSDKQT